MLLLSRVSITLPWLQGNIVEWKKKEGDELASGDILCMVETDKVRSQHSIFLDVWALSVTSANWRKAVKLPGSPVTAASVCQKC